ncbi:hypothetical protein GCU56_20100 [Geodermatophilus sabuli]|uniref:Alkylhydroperoxidase family enzyme, contains CxxC motif n=2 Tax=Geodermatophilus sabuli TaxID=1564158 RepID=A0A7K3W7H6_9ACTN|nr:hypothetical protein [Geodermatophilus sabuli]
MESSRVWAHQPALHDGLFALLQQTVAAAGLTSRQRGVLVAACAAARGDAYCALAWGGRLAQAAGADVAAGVLRGEDDGLDDAERALARWARCVVGDPNGTTAADVADLRAAGFDDGRIVALTAFVALRLAFSSVNDALGAAPDRQLAEGLPPQVVDAVRFGRPVGG